MRRIIAICAALVMAFSTIVVPQSAQAALHNLRIGLTNEPVYSDDLLTVTGTSDLSGGEVCIVEVGSNAENCDSPAWGTVNQIITIGTFIERPIEAPPLKPGKWKLIAVDRGYKSSETVFEVFDCGDNCNPAGAIAAMAAWKQASAAQLPFYGSMCVGAGAVTIGRDAFKGFQGLRNLLNNIKHVENDIARLRGLKDALSDEEWRNRMSDLLKTKSNLEKLLKPALMASSMDASRGGALGGVFQQMRDATDSAWGGYVKVHNAFDVVKGKWWATTSAWTAGKLLANINCRAALMHSDIVADPPDFNYGTVAQPVFYFDPAGLAEDEPLVQLLRATDEAQAYGTAARIAVERLQGAQEDGDGAGIERQAGAAAEFNRLLREASLRQADLLEEVAEIADLHEVWDGSRRDSLADLDQWQRRAATGEITEEERITLSTEFGLSDEEIDDIGAWQAEWAPTSFPTVEERWAQHAAYVAEVRENGLSADEVTQLQELGADAATIEDLEIQISQQNTAPAQLAAEQTDRMRDLADAVREQAWPSEQFSLWLDQVAASAKTAVTPVRPTINFITECGSYGSVELPTVEGLTYTATPTNAREGRVTVKATPLPGYEIATGATSVWNIDLGTYQACQNEAIVAHDLSIEMPKGAVVSIDVGQLIGSTSAYTTALAGQASNGNARRVNNTTFEYRPAATFVGTDSFSYRATVNGAPTQVATGTITVTVTETVVEVTPEAPTYTQITHCNQYGSVTLPAVTGLTYTADPVGAREGVVVVTATANAGYAIASGATSGWNIDLGTHVACEGNSIAAQDYDFALRRGYYGTFDVGSLITASGAYNTSITVRPTNGSVVSRGGTTYEYRPTADFAGTTTFTFRATLTADTSVWAEGTVTINVLEVNDPPVVTANRTSITMNEGANVPSPYTVSDPNRDSLTYLWEASTGATATSASPGNLGFVDDLSDGWVELTVTDSHGAATTGERIPVVVNNVAPTITGTMPVRAVPGVEADLELSVTDPGINDNPTLTWDFGDGSPTATGTQVRHTWSAGTYTLRVTAEDKDGGTRSRTSTVRVAPTVADAGPELFGIVGENLQFDFRGSTAPDPWLTYTADIPAAGTFRSVGTTFSQRYTTAGDYVVTLRLTDARDGGKVTEDTVNVKIRETDFAVVGQVIPGTVRGGFAEVRAIVYDRRTWLPIPATPVQLTVGTTVQELATDDDGVASARIAVDRSASPFATVEFEVVDDGVKGGAVTTIEVERQTKPAADIVFLVDESGSMGSAQAAVASQITAMSEQLSASLDYTFGIWGFPSGHGHTNAHPHWPQTSNLDDFTGGVSALYTSGGGSEWGTDAIVLALEPRNGWRSGAAQCVVLVADEALQSNLYTAEQAGAALSAAGATLFSVTTPNTGAGYKALAEASGGADFSIRDFTTDPQPVLEALLTRCQEFAEDRPDLSVTVEDGLTAVDAGSDQTYTIRVTNDGTEIATGVELLVELPSALTLVSGALATSIGSLEPDGEWTGQIVARTAPEHPGGDVEVYASVSDDGLGGADPTPDDNEDSDVTTIRLLPTDLVASIDDGVTSVTAGDEQHYELRVTNVAKVSASGVTVEMTLPAGVTVVDVAGGNQGGDVLTWSAGTLAADGGTWTRTVVLRTPADHPAGMLTARLSANDDGARGQDPTPDNNVDTDVTEVNRPAPTPTPKPTPTPTPTPSTPPVNPDLLHYVTPGYHKVNGRDWFTQCEPYSQTSRCWTYIWARAARVQPGGGYGITDGWLFNNLTYLPSKRALWVDNPLGQNAEWVATTDGRPWRTECDTRATGRNACRSYNEVSVLVATPKGGGKYTYAWQKRWLFNNMVLFS